MSGKFIVLAVGAIGWLFASLLAFVIVALVGFFGIGLIGLLFWFICTRSELEANWSARQDMTRAERAGRRHEQSVANQSIRFFKNVGVGLTVIGFGGFLYGLGAFDI